MTTITVDRRTWHRGQRNGMPKLLREDGTRCCIGFMCSQLGASDEILKGRSVIDAAIFGDPSELFLDLMKSHGLVSGRSNNTELWVQDAYVVNDNPSYTDAERESKLKQLGAANGFDFQFVN